MPQAIKTVTVHNKNRGGICGKLPSLRRSRDSSTATRPRVWLCSSFIRPKPPGGGDHLRSSGAAWSPLRRIGPRQKSCFRFPTRRLSVVLASRNLTNHEADVGVTGKGRRLEHALHNERSDVLIDLK